MRIELPAFHVSDRSLAAQSSERRISNLICGRYPHRLPRELPPARSKPKIRLNGLNVWIPRLNQLVLDAPAVRLLTDVIDEPLDVFPIRTPYFIRLGLHL